MKLIKRLLVTTCIQILDLLLNIITRINYISIITIRTYRYIVQKKKRNFLLQKPLIHCSFYKQITSFIRKYWEEVEYFCGPYTLKYPILNQSIKWRYDYIIALKNREHRPKKVKK